MYAKVFVAVLLLSVAHQGCANSDQSTNSIGYSYDVFDAIEGAVDLIPYLGFGNGLTKGLAACKFAAQSIVADLRSVAENFKGIRTDSWNAYTDYKACKNKENPEAVKACKQQVKKNYIAAVKLRAQAIRGAFFHAISGTIRLPLCVFQKDPQ